MSIDVVNCFNCHIIFPYININVISTVLLVETILILGFASLCSGTTQFGIHVQEFPHTITSEIAGSQGRHMFSLIR